MEAIALALANLVGNNNGDNDEGFEPTEEDKIDHRFDHVDEMRKLTEKFDAALLDHIEDQQKLRDTEREKEKKKRCYYRHSLTTKLLKWIDTPEFKHYSEKDDALFWFYFSGFGWRKAPIEEYIAKQEEFLAKLENRREETRFERMQDEMLSSLDKKHRW